MELARKQNMRVGNSLSWTARLHSRMHAQSMTALNYEDCIGLADTSNPVYYSSKLVQFDARLKGGRHCGSNRVLSSLTLLSSVES